MRVLFWVFAPICTGILLWILLEDNDDIVDGMTVLKGQEGRNALSREPLLKLSDLKYAFARVDEVDASQVSMEELSRRTDKRLPFVVRNIVKKPPLNLSALPAEEVVVLSRFVRRVPVTPETSRLYPYDRVKGPLGKYLAGEYLDYLEWFKFVKGQQIFMVKRSIDLKHPITSELDRIFWEYFGPFVPVPADGSVIPKEPSYRIQRSPFTYPFHFDCCDNWAFQAVGGGGKVFYLHPPDERIGGGFEDVDRIEFMFDKESRRNGSWKQKWVQAHLNPGDAVYIPLGWYHGVISDGSTKFCLSFNSAIDRINDKEYEERVEQCDKVFADLYPQQEEILDEGIDYAVPNLVWRKIVSSFHCWVSGTQCA